MALYDNKIAKYCKKVRQLEARIRSDTEERKRLVAEISRLRYLSLCEKLNCDGENLESVLSREHEQIMRMKERGLTDAEIDAMGSESRDTIKFYAEDEDENKDD